MRPPRWAVSLACVIACGGRVAATPSDTSSGDTSSSTDESTGEPDVCTPVVGAAIDAEHRRDDPGMPGAGDAVEVAAGPSGAIVAAMTDGDEDDDDVLVTGFGASDNVQWSTRYEGMAGLQDAALDVVVDRDGYVYALVREQISELVSEGFGNRNRWALVVLAIGPGGEHRWRYQRSNDPAGDEDLRSAALVVDGDGRLVLVDADANGADTGALAFTALDRHGNTLLHVEPGTNPSGAPSVELAAAADGDVVVAVGAYAERWIARLAADGAILWEHGDEVDDEYVSAIAVDHDDVAWTLLSTGDVEAGTAGFALHRHDRDGVALPVLDHAFEGGSGYAGGLVIDCDGKAIVAAETGFAPDRRAEIIAVTGDGAVAWSTELESSRPLAPRSLTALGDGGLVIGGLDGENLGPWVARSGGPQ
jgi:hypothetical protein